MKYQVAVIGMIICCLPGCVYRDWIAHTFQQADTVNVDALAMLHDCFVQHEVLYDGFNTIETFDVLWYAPEVHETLMCIANGEEDTMVSPDTHTIIYMRMDGDRDPWQFRLDADGVLYKPYHVERVLLKQGPQLVFGEELMSFKRRAYKVIFTQQPSQFTLRVCNGQYEAAFPYDGYVQEKECVCST